MSKLEIKKAFISDIPLIIELTKRVWPQTYVPIIGAEQVAYMLDIFYSPAVLQKQMEELGHQFVICYADTEPVGFASWSPIDNLVYKLHKLYVLPDCQGSGIGRQLIAHIARDISAQGASVLLLNVNRYNYNAIAFYEKNGFEHYRDEDIDIGHGYFMNDHVLSLKV
jgi:diamine N-acetyltransferase